VLQCQVLQAIADKGYDPRGLAKAALMSCDEDIGRK
jgi:hypothetical protein